VHIWHLTADAPRTPLRVSPGEKISLTIGSWPIEPGQSVSVACRVDRAAGGREEFVREATWAENRPPNSYWRVALGPFERGDKITYTVTGRSNQGVTAGPTNTFRVGPRLHLALLWHQHQPVYKDTTSPSPRGSYTQPWVRLHALRDYHGMAAIVAQHPGVHLTINLVPCLLWQLDDYLSHGATDRALELTLKRPELLDDAERAVILSTFFDADQKNQIAPHARYLELFEQRRRGDPFSTQDLRDLQVWFSLAWFAVEFRRGDVQLVTGDRVSIHHLVDKQRGFDDQDVTDLVAAQYQIMKAVVPIHRALQEEGQIEVSSTPFFHPILPLLVDTDQATIDRPGTSHPRRFAHPEDAQAQVDRAIDSYRQFFRRRPRGMWPAEGAVSQSILPLFARHRVRWIATDRGVLAKSGRHGYRVDDPDVLCRPYRAVEGDAQISVFFRDTRLSDDIGFVYSRYPDPEQAAQEFLKNIKERFSQRLRALDDRVLTVVVDGENAWGGYQDDGRPFLHALYSLLEQDREIQTVTFAEYLEGNPERGVAHHALSEQTQVHDLFTGSWIDEAGSAPGVDLGTWIGEIEENVAWNLLGETRDFLTRRGATPASDPRAFEALYMAEGSDWFWWFGDDQDSGRDSEFDDLFRMHLQNVYRSVGETPPPALSEPIVPHTHVWVFGSSPSIAPAGHELTVRTPRPGTLGWSIDGAPPTFREVTPVGGVMSNTVFYQTNLGPLDPAIGEIRFTFSGEIDEDGPVRALRVARPIGRG
jgi:alpha-amylase/alpha-mannosidase (GH57 family)